MKIGSTRPITGPQAGTAITRPCKICQAKPWGKCRDLRPNTRGGDRYRKTFHPGR